MKYEIIIKAELETDTLKTKKEIEKTVRKILEAGWGVPFEILDILKIDELDWEKLD